MNADYAGLFQALRPEAHLVIGALLVLTIDMIWARHRPAAGQKALRKVRLMRRRPTMG